jgi:protein tyrosine phosphatase (PTP) superfamily phosphohydrolase (DUF442 family)
MSEKAEGGRVEAGASAGRRRVLRLLLTVLLVVGLGLALRYGWWQTFGNRLATVSEGKVYRSAQMGPGALEGAVEKYGLRSVLDLRYAKEEPGQRAREIETLERLGVRYLHLPTDQVPRLETVDRFLELASDPENLPMLIHCKHGEGRSVLFSALYRIEFEGWDRDEARKASRLLHFRGSFSRDAPKGRFLLEYQPRLDESP